MVGELGLSAFSTLLAVAEDASGGLGTTSIPGAGDQHHRGMVRASSRQGTSIRAGYQWEAFALEGGRVCIEPPQPAGLCSSASQGRQGCEQEPGRQEMRPSRCPVCGRRLCWPHPVLVLSPHLLHKECLIK